MEKSYKHVESIMKHPLTKLRMIISNGFLSKSINMEAFEKLIPIFENLVTNFSDIDKLRIDNEIEKIHNTFATGSCDELPDLEHPVTQLLWGSAMSIIFCDENASKNWPKENLGNGPITDTKIWKLLKDSPGAKKELKKQASFMVSKSFAQKDTKVRWGATDYPGVGYYFSPDQNIINMDLLWGMIAGFEHARSANMHELAHSQGTIAYPPRLQKIQEEMDKYDSVKKFSIEDYKKMAKLRQEWELRFRIFDEAENNFANGFVKSLTENGLVDQDLSESVNTIETTICDFGNVVQKNSKRIDEKKDITLDDKYHNLKKVVRYGFYQNNELFENTPEEWRKAGVHIEWLEGVDNNGRKMSPQECLNDLLDCCHKLEEEQLPLRIFASPTPHVVESVNNKSKRRAEIIDDITNRYFSPIIDEKIKIVEDEIEQQVQKMQDQQGGGGEGKDEDAQEGDSGEQNSQDQQGGGGEGKDEDAQEGDSGGGEGKDDAFPSQKKEKNKINVEGLGEVDAIEIPKGNPNQERNKNLEIEDNDKGNSLDDIINDTQDSKEGELGKKGSDNKADSENNKEVESQSWSDSDNAENNVSHGNSGNIQYKIKKQSNSVWRYKNIISKNKSLIKKISTYLDLMTNKYVDDNIVQSKDFVPKSDIQESLDIDSIISRIKKSALNQELKEDDFKHFNNPEEPSLKVAPTDICIMIDTSGSMHGAHTDKFAIELGCAFYEAAKSNPYYNVYVGLMTSPVLYIAEPGDSDNKIAEKLAYIYNSSYYSDDKIGDCIISTANKICTRKQDYDREGMAHFFFITDGYHTDDSAEVVQSFLDKSSVTTFNWLLTDKVDPLNSAGQSIASRIILNNQQKRGTKAPAYAMCKTNLEVAAVLPKLLAKRVKECSYLPAINSTIKRNQLQKASDGFEYIDITGLENTRKGKKMSYNYMNYQKGSCNE